MFTLKFRQKVKNITHGKSKQLKEKNMYKNIPKNIKHTKLNNDFYW